MFYWLVAWFTPKSRRYEHDPITDPIQITGIHVDILDWS